MEKSTIETFIKKYNLGGLVDGVRWVVSNKTLRVTAMTSDKKFLTSITQKKFDGLPDSEFGIIDTDKLKSLLGALSETVTMSLITDPTDGRIISIDIGDGKTDASHMCGHLDVVGDEPKIKQLPSYDVEITLTEEFIERFSKAQAALKEFELFSLLMDKKTQKLKLVIGYARTLTSRLALEIPVVAGKDTVKTPISFSAKNLKAILAANSEVKDPVLKVSEAGLAFVEFDTPEFQSQYYMIKIDVED